MRNQLEFLLEERPAVEAVPGLPERTGDGEVGTAFLQTLAQLAGSPRITLICRPGSAFCISASTVARG